MRGNVAVQSEAIGWEFIAECIRWARNTRDVEEVFLVGSYARGEELPNSDVDIFFVLKEHAGYVSSTDWLQEITAIDGQRCVKVSYVNSIAAFSFVTHRGLEVELGVAEIGWDHVAPRDEVDRIRETGWRRVYRRMDQENPYAESATTQLARIRRGIINCLSQSCGEQYWAAPAPTIDPALMSVLAECDHSMLINREIWGVEDNRFVWRLRPFAHDGLLLFCDLESQRERSDYVWLRTKASSDSWRFLDAITITQQSTVLDLGCGSGLNALRAAQRGARALGVDVNPRAVSLARLNAEINGLSRASFLNGDWNSVGSEQYDVVVSQPPFDPVIPGNKTRTCYDGGGRYGLQYTEEILRRFSPKQVRQQLHIYTHSFACGGVACIDSLLYSLAQEGLVVSWKRGRSTPIKAWYQAYLDRHPEAPPRLPEEWGAFTQVIRYVISVARSPSMKLRRLVP
jgi:SAM-dependent methyltransferase/predicted nucleotidyltransferase